MRLLLPFAVILASALALIPGGAHLLAMFAKMSLPQEQYFIVQAIYRGWAMAGAAWFAALALDLALAFAFRAEAAAFRPALGAAALVMLSLVVFFAWTYPANVATRNWTTQPANWASLRAQWEISHAVNAGLIFLSLIAATVAALRAARL